MHQTLGRSMSFNVEQMTALFTRSDGTYLCARWGRPIAAVIFGLEESSLGLFKGAIESIVHLAGHEMAEIDPEFSLPRGESGHQRRLARASSIKVRFRLLRDIRLE